MNATPGFSKQYSPEFEPHLYKQRERSNIFSPEGQGNIKADAGSCVIGLPPPNVTGLLHAGHALTITIEDVMVRYQRMCGKKTLWIPGTDHAGIATQIKVEEHLAQTEGKTKNEIGREAFIQKTRDRVKKNRSAIVSQTKRMGASCDRSREQFTLSEQLSRAVRKSFTNLYKEGKIYQGAYITNRCPVTQTVISDVEIEYHEGESKMYYIRYFMDSKSDSIVIATTRPETIFADVAIAVHPQDKKYKKLIGKTVLIPIINRPIPIIGDEYVDMSFGTGALKITPAHDQHGFEVAKRHNLPLDIFAFDKQGNFTEHAGSDFAGQSVEQFTENIINFLADIGNLVKTQEHIAKIPYSDRGKAKIQPMLSTQWFVDVRHYASEVSLAVRRDEVKVTPAKYKETFYQWLDNIKPRCISRQLWRGHRIPVRYTESGTPYALDEDVIIAAHQTTQSTKYIVLSIIIFNLIADSRLPSSFGLEELIDLLTSASITPQQGTVLDVYIRMYRHTFQEHVVLLREVDQLSFLLTKAKEDPEQIGQLVDILEESFAVQIKGDRYQYNLSLIAGEELIRQDEDVFDTRFSSALRPFSILGRPDKTPDMDAFYPHTVLETGYDIIFFRVARMLMMGLANTGKLPFHHVYLNGLVRDIKGRKFSKSLGNGINPIDIIKQYGTDSLRLALIINSTPGNDVIFSIDKVKIYAKCINKCRNATRYVYTKILKEKTDTTLDMNTIHKDITTALSSANDFDLWILQKINILIDDVTTHLERYQYGEAGDRIIQMLWHDLCDRYIEISKQQTSPITGTIMVYALGTIFQLLHPYAPFVTEQLWKHLGFGGWLANQTRPTQLDLPDKNYKINLLMETISTMRQLRSQTGSKPHEKVEVFIQSGREFSLFAQKYIKLTSYLIKSSHINYILHGESAPTDYTTAVVADIIIGLKGVVIIDKKTKIAQFEKQLEEEQQYLQSTRASLTNPGFLTNASASLIESKKQKIEVLKQKISVIELELNKLKA